jgi:hypothetical protein
VVLGPYIKQISSLGLCSYVVISPKSTSLYLLFNLRKIHLPLHSVSPSNKHTTIQPIKQHTHSIPPNAVVMPASVEYLTRSNKSYDFDSDPVQAMTNYARSMHNHTKSQMEAATKAARKRSSRSRSPHPEAALLHKEASISSQASRSSY